MKKRLIYGLVLVLFLFTIGAAVVIKNLDNIVMNQRLINEQDAIIARYNEMLFQMKERKLNSTGTSLDTREI